MIVLDTSVVYSHMDRADPDHGATCAWLEGLDEELITTPFAVAEMDHLVARHATEAASRALRRNLRSGAYRVEWWSDALLQTLGVVEQRPDLGITDASLVALAARLRTVRVATLDERHFRAVAPLTGQPAFVLLPSDA